MDKTKKKFHINHPPYEAGYQGVGPNPLYEPVPNFIKRPGDGTIGPNGLDLSGADNNTIIIFGRDRNPFKKNKDGKTEKPGNDPMKTETVSGYSQHMGRPICCAWNW
mgnify:FL=1